jgi:hypothetical protein
MLHFLSGHRLGFADDVYLVYALFLKRTMLFQEHYAFSRALCFFKSTMLFQEIVQEQLRRAVFCLTRRNSEERYKSKSRRYKADCNFLRCAFANQVSPIQSNTNIFRFL